MNILYNTETLKKVLKLMNDDFRFQIPNFKSTNYLHLLSFDYQYL